MSHQVAGKAIEALAYYGGDRYVTGHSVSDLVTDLKSSYPPLSGHLKLAKTLDRYYVPTRYPDALPGGAPFEVYDDRDDAVAAAEGAEAVMATVLKIIES